MRQRAHRRQATSMGGSRRGRAASGGLFVAQRFVGAIAVALMLMHCVLFADGFSTVLLPAAAGSTGSGFSTIVWAPTSTLMTLLTLVTETLGGGATTRSMSMCASQVAVHTRSTVTSLATSDSTSTVLAAAAGSVAVGAVVGAGRCFLKRTSTDSSPTSIALEAADHMVDNVTESQHVMTAKRQRRSHPNPNRSRAIPRTYDWRDGVTNSTSTTARGDIALDMDGYPSNPTPVNIFTAVVGQKVYVPRVQADGLSVVRS